MKSTAVPAASARSGRCSTRAAIASPLMVRAFQEVRIFSSGCGEQTPLRIALDRRAHVEVPRALEIRLAVESEAVREGGIFACGQEPFGLGASPQVVLPFVAFGIRIQAR